MVLFAKNAVTKSYLFGQRLANSAGAQPARNFSYLIKSLPRPENFRKLPHPDHVKGIIYKFRRLIVDLLTELTSLNCFLGVSLWRNVFFLAGLPAVLLVNINISFFEDHFPKRADFHAYEYKHKRTKVTIL